MNVLDPVKMDLYLEQVFLDKHVHGGQGPHLAYSLLEG